MGCCIVGRRKLFGGGNGIPAEVVEMVVVAKVPRRRAKSRREKFEEEGENAGVVGRR